MTQTCEVNTSHKADQPDYHPAQILRWTIEGTAVVQIKGFMGEAFVHPSRIKHMSDKS